jgi:hypothetical protein
MLAEAMPAARKPTKRQPPPAPEKMTQFNVRIAPTTHDALLAWLDRVNATRRVPLTQSELVRAALEWCIENEPDVDRK